MLAYLEQAPHDHEKDDPDSYSLDNPDNYKDEETGMGAGDNYPVWFHWYDTHIGPADIMAMPNVRGTLEKRYLDAVRTAKTEAPINTENDKPSLYMLDMDMFVEQTEDYKTIALYKLYKQHMDKKDRWIDLAYEIDLTQIMH